LAVLFYGLIRGALEISDEVTAQTKIPALCLLGWLFIIGGFVGAIYFAFVFDISVGVPQISRDTLGIERVNNLGLMSDRQTGIILSLAALILGTILAIFFRPKPEKPRCIPVASVSPLPLSHPMEGRLHPDPHVQWLRDCAQADHEGRPRPPKP